MSPANGQSRIADFNQAMVLAAIRATDEGVSRVELAESTGLSAQTISNVVRRLINDGWAQESGRVIHGPGKPRTKLQLVPDRCIAVGIHVDFSAVELVLINLHGEVLTQRRDPFGENWASVDVQVAEVQQHIAEMLEATGFGMDKLLGVGIASSGYINTETGVMYHPYIWDDGYAIVEPLKDALNCPVYLVRDMVAATVAERWVGIGRTDSHFMTVYVGAGLGAGFVSDHHVVVGHRGNAGDFTHLEVPYTQEETCPKCGANNCLYINLEPPALKRLFASEGAELPELEGIPPYAEAEVLLAQITDASNDSEAVKRVREHLSTLIGDCVGKIVGLLDQDKVVVSGPLWEHVRKDYGEGVAEQVRSRAEGVVGAPVEVVPTELGPGIAPLGAACVVLDAGLMPRCTFTAKR
ncbi:ROK family transcriptional regulator [Pseudoglutamicibacter albus]|uniref:HTH marR-type domain-containing protein n=2 Tax=Pseudoglutamicibacter albus TaxID=98671 RepID=A0A095YEY4_9MICC|nr:ROK family transcriptional regulator [Pseudoglutamicibacter albus]KGF20980.1 hypothetical protein HMPREF2128_02895 [Pseudoglutamicibacter albus DNF00011]MDR7293008.1 putative NBD/HSP70 family sugar kinase [Pseudoglutamicibacter albus]